MTQPSPFFVTGLHDAGGAEPLPGGAQAQALVLQTLCLPEPAISSEAALFLRLTGGAAKAPDAAGGISFAAGGAADFDTYVNLLDLETWGRRCRLDGLWLRLAGEGRFTLRLRRAQARPGAARPGQADDGSGGLMPLDEALVLETSLTLRPDGIGLDLGGLLAGGGLLMLSLEAQGPGRLTGGAFLTRDPGSDPLRLAIVITTFRREAAVAQTAARITALFDGADREGAAGPGAQLGRAAHLFVIDNGQSLGGGQSPGDPLPAPGPHPKLTVIPNRNLGGAGGFARGLIAAQDGGFSHCLFMDDDASFQMESLIRTHAFLRLARSPAAAVAGAMISEGRPWAMWENGAVFDRFCRPLCHGTDLRNRAKVLDMVLTSAEPKPPAFYGGWWFFAFPLAQVRYHPFPFFVRGDDISFSLANRFDTVTLNGVMSFQEDFAAKESPQTLYLDLRNHLHHHLAQPGLQIGAVATGLIVLRFFARSLVRMHYDSAEAQLLAWEDVMQGPQYFIANADMAAKRAEIAGLIRAEAWQPAPGLRPPAKALPPARLLALLMKFTLNGHLLPGMRLWGRRVTVGIAERAPIWPLWGAFEARYADAPGGRSYTVRHDKARFARLGLRALRLGLRWGRAYPALQAAFAQSYGQIAARAFWEAQFKDGPAPVKAAPVQTAPATDTLATDAPAKAAPAKAALAKAGAPQDPAAHG